MSVKPSNDLKDNNCSSVNATLNRYIFRTDINFSRDNTFLISVGNLFHKVGTAILNAESPSDLSRDTRTCNSI